MTKTYKSSILLGTVALFGTLSGLAVAQSSQSADNKFAREAATGGMEEVELGKIAVRSASNEKVKAFGQHMIDDHSKAGDQLKMIASKNNITLPDSLDAKQKAEVDRFSAMSGAAFDKAYMRDMVRDHEKDIAAFQKESSNGMNADLKNWATSTLPTLQMHFQMAKDAESAVGAGGER
jgi:putative membrane protein